MRRELLGGGGGDTERGNGTRSESGWVAESTDLST